MEGLRIFQKVYFLQVVCLVVAVVVMGLAF